MSSPGSKKSKTLLLGFGALALVLVIVFVMKGCKIVCNNKEGFQRQCLGGTCAGMQRSPVDYAMKRPEGWQQNPHWEALPTVRFQPLDFGEVDLYSDSRKLDDGEMFYQYSQGFPGTGTQIFHMQNDEKNRFDNKDIGNYAFSEKMSDLYNYAFGAPGIVNTETQYWDPNPFYDKLYGGTQWLRYGKLI